MADKNLFVEICAALDSIKDDIAKANEAGGDEWIRITIPKLRAQAAHPFVKKALDMVENDPQHRKMFQNFVTDACTKPEFREQLKKSLSDPHLLTLLRAMIPNCGL